jgi:hypothetical protein
VTRDSRLSAREVVAGHPAGVVELVTAWGGGVVEERETDRVRLAVEGPAGAVEARLEDQPVPGHGGTWSGVSGVGPAEDRPAELVDDRVGVRIVGQTRDQTGEQLIGLLVVSGGQVPQPG